LRGEECRTPTFEMWNVTQNHNNIFVSFHSLRWIQIFPVRKEEIQCIKYSEVIMANSWASFLLSKLKGKVQISNRKLLGFDRSPDFNKFDNNKKIQHCFMMHSLGLHCFIRKFSTNLGIYGLALLYQSGFWCIVWFSYCIYFSQVTIELWYSMLIIFWFECSLASVMVRLHNEIILDVRKKYYKLV